MHKFLLTIFAFPIVIFGTMFSSYFGVKGPDMFIGMASYAFSIPIYFVTVLVIIGKLNKDTPNKTYVKFWTSVALACFIAGRLNYFINY